MKNTLVTLLRTIAFWFLLLIALLSCSRVEAQSRAIQCGDVFAGPQATKMCFSTFPDTQENILSVCSSTGQPLNVTGINKTAAENLFDAAVAAFSIPDNSTIRVMVDSTNGPIEFVVTWQGGRLRLARQEARTLDEIANVMKQGGDIWVRN